MSTEAIVVKGDDITIDLLLWRKFRRRTPGLVERVLALNPGLAGHGAILPIGAVVLIPIDAPNSAPTRRNTVRLWS